MEIKVDSHMHSIASGHAYSTIKEIFEVAAKRGMQAVAITDHAPKMPGTCHEMHFLNLDSVPDMICGIKFLPGVELNILNSKGEVDLSERALKRLSVVIASLHQHCYTFESVEATTSALINAMNNPYVKFIGHPGDPKFPFDIERVVCHAVKTGTALEINEPSASEIGSRAGGLKTLKELVRTCVKQGAMLSVGSDGHFCDEVARFPGVMNILNEIEVPERLVVNRNLEAFMSFIEAKKQV